MDELRQLLLQLASLATILSYGKIAMNLHIPFHQSPYAWGGFQNPEIRPVVAS